MLQDEYEILVSGKITKLVGEGGTRDLPFLAKSSLRGQSETTRQVQISS